MTLTAIRTNRSRYVRDTASPSEIALKERDHTIIQLVYNHRFLTLELLWHLLQPNYRNQSVRYSVGPDGKKRPKSYGFGQQALSKRLRQLFQAGYLERHYPTDRPMGRGHGAPRAIYGVGLKSAAVLEERVSVPAYEIRRIVERNRVTSPFLRHAIEVARFRVTLEVACRVSDGSVRLLFWEQGEALRDYVEFTDRWDQKRKMPVYPDAFFGLQLPSGERKHYFLEIDRGTEPISAQGQRTHVCRKLIAYRLYRKSGRFPRRYSYRRLPDGIVVGLDINNGRNSVTTSDDSRLNGFQVLFVTPGIVRSRTHVSGRIANIISQLSDMGRFYATTSLFLFTVPDAYSITRPKSLLDRCWLTPRAHNELRSLLE